MCEPDLPASDRGLESQFALGTPRACSSRHNGWLDDGSLLRDADSLADIPGIMVNGRYDFQAPITNAWELNRVWPRAELVIVDNAGHTADNADITQELILGTDRFADRR